MTDWPKIRRNGLVSLFGACILLGVIAAWVGSSSEPRHGDRPVAEYPALFSDEVLCSNHSNVLDRGRKAEELGRIRADRYAYDPRDGIRAVQLYQEAEACYRSAGAERAAARVHQASTALIARIRTDYAAGRLNLTNALEQERWSDALVEIHRLLFLTDHLGRHEYVEWLKRTVGSVAAKASSSS